MPATTATAMMCDSVGSPHSMASGRLPTVKKRPTSHTSITRRRSQRSTMAPTGRHSSTKGVTRRAVTQPTVSGEPVSASTSRG